MKIKKNGKVYKRKRFVRLSTIQARCGSCDLKGECHCECMNGLGRWFEYVFGEMKGLI